MYGTETVSVLSCKEYCGGLAGVEMACASDFSVPQQRLQQEFRLTHPAASTPSCLTLTTSGMCSFFLYLSTISPTQAHTHVLS